MTLIIFLRFYIFFVLLDYWNISYQKWNNKKNLCKEDSHKWTTYLKISNKKKTIFLNLSKFFLLPLLHFPLWHLLIFPALLHLAWSNRHWLLYVFPSVPQTGWKFLGQCLLHAVKNKINSFLLTTKNKSKIIYTQDTYKNFLSQESPILADFKNIIL